MLDDLALFIQIVEAGSLNMAAMRANIPPSTLTRRLQRLEQQLKCKLLLRSARNLQPTQEGLQYYEQCRPLINALKQSTNQLDETFHQVKGTIRILAPINLANGLLASAWAEFIKKYPEVSLKLELSNHNENLAEKGADLAIRVGKLSSSLLKMRRLGTISKSLLVASPAYLENKPAITKVSDLDQHDLIVAEPLSIWLLQLNNGSQTIRYVPDPRFCVNELGLAVQAACNGLGVLYCPINICFSLVQQGKLIPVLNDWHSEPRDVYIVWPEQSYVPARTRALIDYLVGFSKEQPFLNGEI